MRSGRFISCGNNGERSEPTNEASRERSDGGRMDKRGEKGGEEDEFEVVLFMQSIDRRLSASLIV